jgi:hypothetical protein
MALRVRGSANAITPMVFLDVISAILRDDYFSLLRSGNTGLPSS